jgi:hypothetical protein
MRSARPARWCALISVALLLAAPTRVRAAGPDRNDEPENEEAQLQNKFFDEGEGIPLDGRRYLAMWNAARAMRQEPGGLGTSAVNGWQLVGPLYSVNTGGGNITGRVRDIDAHNRRVLAASGGLWRFNFGAIAMSDSVPAAYFGSFATKPSDPNTILLGTGEYHFGEQGTGLYKSSDGGATWASKLPGVQPTSICRVRYSPDGTIVHAATSLGYYRSIDDGETWTRTLTGTVTDLCTVNGDSNLLYAMLASQGLYRSADGGVTWGAMTSGGIPSGAVGDGAVTALRPLPGGPVFLYVAYNTSVWRSMDSGASWTNVTPPYTYGVSNYGPCISVCPSDPFTVLMGNVPLNRTTDGGDTWNKIVSSNLHADYHVFAWDDDGIGVWTGNDGGWFHSTDRGLNWDSSSNVMPVSQFYTIDCERNEVGYMIGGTQDNNILYTPTEALFWTDPALGSTEGDATGAAVDQYNPSHMWGVSGVSGGSYAYPRYRTVDGTTWLESNTGIDPNPFNGVLRTDNAFPVDLVTSAGPFVYESTDGGLTWTKANGAGFPASIRSLTSSQRVAPNAVLYAATISSTSGQRLFVRDGGLWSERSFGLPAGQVVKVVPHPWAAYADVAWAILQSGGISHLYRTDNRGQSWTDVTGDFPGLIPVTDLMPNPYNSVELFVGTRLGCYRTRNGGVNWERWTNGMPPQAIVSEMTSIDLSSTTGQFFVVAATYGRSVWKRDITGDDPTPTVTVGNATCIEGNSGLTYAFFPVTLSYGYPSTVAVHYSTVDGTATASDNDYQPASGIVSFPPGVTASGVTVIVNGDTRIEPDESFSLALSNPLHCTIANSGTATILDDDSHALANPNAAITDGTVNAVTVSGNTVYVGGSFSHIGPATGSALPLDAASGQPLTLPRVAGDVYAVAPDGAGGWYLGGRFTAVGGLARPNLAHVLADGSVSPWAPIANDMVFTLAVSGNTVYAGGLFTSINGTARNHLASFPSGGDQAGTWDPDADGTVWSLALSGTTLYVGGAFSHIHGQPHDRLAAVSTTTGLPSAWSPNADAEVLALALSGNTVYAGGVFTTVGGVPRRGLAAVDATSGALRPWNPSPNSDVYALALNGATLYAGGAFDSIGLAPRSYVAAIDTATGQATAWAPDADQPVRALSPAGSLIYAGGDFSSIGGQPRSFLAALDASSGTATAWNPAPNGTVMAIVASGGTVFAAGQFTSIGVVSRNSLAALDATTGLVTDWNPGAHGAVRCLGVRGSALFAGGSFDSLGGQARARLGAVDVTTGAATSWNPGPNATVLALLLTSTSEIVGGQFTSFGGVTRNRIAAFTGSSNTPTTWNPNSNGTVAALATDGALVYAGGAFTNIGGQARTNLAALNGATGAASTWNPAPNGAVTALAMNGSAVFAGGDFTSIAGAARGHAALMSTTQLSPWNPGANGLVEAIGPAGGSAVYLGGSFTSLAGEPRSALGQSLLLGSGPTDWAPNPDDDVRSIALNGSAVWVGGDFKHIAGLPLSHVACLIPINSVDVAAAPSVVRFEMRLGPTPTTGRVRVEYTLPQTSRVRIGVYDVLGRRVGATVDETQLAGRHEMSWDGPDGHGVAMPGLYFVRAEAGDRHAEGRFVVVR